MACGALTAIGVYLGEWTALIHLIGGFVWSALMLHTVDS